jgi:hypothetical protein
VPTLKPTSGRTRAKNGLQLHCVAHFQQPTRHSPIHKSHHGSVGKFRQTGSVHIPIFPQSITHELSTRASTAINAWSSSKNTNTARNPSCRKIGSQVGNFPPNTTQPFKLVSASRRRTFPVAKPRSVALSSPPSSFRHFGAGPSGHTAPRSRSCTFALRNPSGSPGEPCPAGHFLFFNVAKSFLRLSNERFIPRI